MIGLKDKKTQVIIFAIIIVALIVAVMVMRQKTFLKPSASNSFDQSQGVTTPKIENSNDLDNALKDLDNTDSSQFDKGVDQNASDALNF